jgi:hypothetical protein
MDLPDARDRVKSTQWGRLAMETRTLALIIVGLSSAILFGIQLWARLDSNSKRHEFSHNFAQAVYGTLAAVAIIGAAALFLIERQWSPRLVVDVKSRAVLVPASKPAAVTIQSIVAIRNYGRTEQIVRDIEVGVESYAGSNLTTNEFGDVHAHNVAHYVRRLENSLMPGELDLIPIEIAIPCSEQLVVRIIVKVPQPSEDARDGVTHLHERKSILPLAGVCSGKDLAAEVPFQSTDLAFGGEV